LTASRARTAKDGSEIHKRVVPIVFGRSLVDPFQGFALHMVQPGETLSAIAQQWYSDAGRFRTIFDANRNQLTDPDVIFPGQVLRIPRSRRGKSFVDDQTGGAARMAWMRVR
jgi:nucleoid-associated protein YgaU